MNINQYIKSIFGTKSHKDLMNKTRKELEEELPDTVRYEVLEKGTITNEQLRKILVDNEIRRNFVLDMILPEAIEKQVLDTERFTDYKSTAIEILDFYEIRLGIQDKKLKHYDFTKIPTLVRLELENLGILDRPILEKILEISEKQRNDTFKRMNREMLDYIHEYEKSRNYINTQRQLDLFIIEYQQMKMEEAKKENSIKKKLETEKEKEELESSRNSGNWYIKGRIRGDGVDEPSIVTEIYNKGLSKRESRKEKSLEKKLRESELEETKIRENIEKINSEILKKEIKREEELKDEYREIENTENLVANIFKVTRKDIEIAGQMLDNIRKTEKINNPKYNLILEEDIPFSKRRYEAKAFMARYEVYRREISKGHVGYEDFIRGVMDNYDKYNTIKRGKKLGEGGFGIVYSGFNKTLDIPVASKKMIKPENILNFLKEECIASIFVHPNIVELFGVNVNKGIIFSRKYMGDATGFEGNVNEDMARMYFKQISEALLYIHNMGYVHHDIKPENFFVKTKKEFVIADFGLTRRYANPRNEFIRPSRGTALFMPPEVFLFSGKASVQATDCDVWAIGVSLYFLIKGKAPFAKGSIKDKDGKVIQIHSYAEAYYHKVEPDYMGLSPKLVSMFKKIFHINGACLAKYKANPNFTKCILSAGRYTTIESVMSDPWYNA